MPTREQVDVKLQEGNKLVKIGNIEQAIQSYTDGLDLFQYSTISRETKGRLMTTDHSYIISLLIQRRAELFDRLYRFKEAQKDLLELTKYRPSAKAHALLGDVYQKQGLYKIAMDEYKKAQKLNQTMVFGPVAENLKKCQELQLVQEKKPLERQEMMDDVMMQILSFLSVTEVLKMGIVSYHFNRLIKDNAIWIPLFKQLDPVLFQGIIDSKSFTLGKNQELKLNWRRLYMENLYIGDIYFTGDEEVKRPLKYNATDRRGIIGMSDSICWNEIGQYFFIEEFKQEQPAFYLKFDKELDCDLGSNFELGPITMVDGRRDGVTFISIVWHSGVFGFFEFKHTDFKLIPSKQTYWRMDSKANGYVTNFEKTIQKITNGIILTHDGQVYMNQTSIFDVPEKIFNIFSQGNDLAMIGQSGTLYLAKIHQFTWNAIKDFKSKVIKIMFASHPMILTFQGELFVFKDGLMKQIKPTRIGDNPYIKDFVATSKLTVIVTRDNRIFGEGIIPHAFGNGGSYGSNSLQEIATPVGNVMSISSYDDHVWWFLSNSKPTIQYDIPDEKLVCGICQQEYEKFKNHAKACKFIVKDNELFSHVKTGYHRPKF